MKKLQCVIHSPSDNTSLIKKRIAQTLINETSNIKEAKNKKIAAANA